MITERRYHGNSGFTLIELLIGTMISAMLLAALYAVFHGLLAMQARAYAGIEEALPRIPVISMIQNDLKNMVVPNGLLCGAVLGQTKAQGDRRLDTLELYAASGRVGQTAPWGDVQKVGYTLVESADFQGAGNAELVRTVTRNLLATNLEDQGEAVTLLRNVSVLKFQYFDGVTWLDSWDSTTAAEPLPKAVRVRVEFEADEVRTMANAPIEIVCEVVAQNPVAVSAEG